MKKSELKFLIETVLQEKEHIDMNKLIEYAKAIDVICNGEYGDTYYNPTENHVMINLGDSNPFDEDSLKEFIVGAIRKKNYEDEKFIKISIEDEAGHPGEGWLKFDGKKFK